MARKSTHWRVYTPGDFYPGDYEYRELKTEREVRADLRAAWKLKRLPNGTFVEPVNEKADRALREIIRRDRARDRAQGGYFTD